VLPILDEDSNPTLETGSNPLRWWTRSQRIRTAASLPFQAAVDETRRPPIYQQISSEAIRLRRLGLSVAVAAKSLGVSDKTIAKAVRWGLDAADG
jgi:hypothetical protein